MEHTHSAVAYFATTEFTLPLSPISWYSSLSLHSMNNTPHNPRFPRKARPSSRTRFGAQTGRGAGAPQGPQKSWGKTHFGKIEGSAATRDARRPDHTDTSRPAAPFTKKFTKFGSKFGSKSGAPTTPFTKTPHSNNQPVTRLKGPSPIPTRAPGEFPMRINKYLAWKGYATRQGADEMI